MTDPTDTYLAHRELLFSLVYNMLGSVADTEDVLQETWLAWAGRDVSTVVHPRAYLVRIAVNAALARQDGIRRRRETYVGPWLPEPVPDDDDDRSDAVSVAMLVVLETLSPLERAVFVLHDVFGYPHAEVATMLGRTPAAVRQVAHRAREHVRARRPRFPVDPRQQRELTERFVGAAAGGDLAALLDLLAPAAVLIADGGGRAPAAGRHPVHGAEPVARALVAGARRFPTDVETRYRTVNGGPAAVLYRGDAVFAVLVVEPVGDRIGAVYLVSNPDKLTRVR